MSGFRVGDDWRTNQMSNVPGGSIVIVEYVDGQRMVYDKIKYPSAYIRRVKSDPLVKRAWVKDI